MAGAGVRQRPRGDVELRVRDGRHAPDAVARDVAVERVEQRARGQAGRRERADRAAQLAHHRRGLDAVPDDVADDEADRRPLVAEPEGVVPVAADLDAGACAGR